MQEPLQEEAEAAFARAGKALAAGNTVEALIYLEKGLKLKDDPAWYAALGYCMARERGQFKRGIELCQSSLEREPDEPSHYLYLGQIHLLAGNKPEALRVLREGMTRGGSPELQRQLAEIGTRKSPLFASLPRKHPLNRILGQLLNRLGLR